MSIAVAQRPYALAGWVLVPFVLIHLLDGFWKSALLRGPHIEYWIYDFTKWIILPILLLAYLHRATAFSGRDYGLSDDLGVRDVFHVLLLPLLSLFFINYFAVRIANEILGWPKPNFDHGNALDALGPLWIVGTIYFSVTAGLWESIFFIGIPWLWFKRGGTADASSRHTFAVASALLFAAGHWENGFPNVIGAFFFQLLAIWWYFKFRNLWPVIGAHILIDVYYFWPAKI